MSDNLSLSFSLTTGLSEKFNLFFFPFLKIPSIVRTLGYFKGKQRYFVRRTSTSVCKSTNLL